MEEQKESYYTFESVSVLTMYLMVLAVLLFVRVSKPRNVTVCTYDCLQHCIRAAAMVTVIACGYIDCVHIWVDL